MSSRADPRAEKVSGLSSRVQNILNILKTSEYPSWFEQNITWVKNEQISQDEFISAFDYGVSNGFIKTSIPSRPEPEPSKRPTSIFREPTPEPRDEPFTIQTPVNEPLGSFWRVGNSVTTSSKIGISTLANAIDRNFNSYGYFDTGVVGSQLEGIQYFTINFDRTYKATEFKYKVSAQAWHSQGAGLGFNVSLELQHYNTDSQNWVTDKIVKSQNQYQPQEYIITTSPTNSNSMRVKFSGGDNVLRVYEMQMFSKEVSQVQEPEPVQEITEQPIVKEEPIIQAPEIPDIIPQAQAQQITLSSETLTIIEGIENGTYKVPTWFEQNIEWVKLGAITEQEFQNAFNFLIEQGTGIDTSIPEENTAINFPMVKQLGVSWRIEEGRVKGRVVLDKISSNWNPYYDDRNLISMVQFKDVVNKLPLMPIKQNIVKFRPTEEPLLPTEEITIDEGIGAYQNALIEVFLWTENNEPVAEPLRFNINGSPIDVIAKPSQDNFLTKAVGLFAGLTGISLLLTGAKKLS